MLSNADFLRDYNNIPNPDDEESETDDHIEERNWSTDTEQYTLSEEENNEDPSFNYYIGKDQKTKWKKALPPKNVRTRSENIITHLPGVKAMSENRFRFLLRVIRFDDKAKRNERLRQDELAAVRLILDTFVKNCQKHYSPSEYITVDEKLDAFRGKCNFRQYIPSKHNKYGIKLFALVDSKMFYTCNLEIYSGKNPEGPYNVSNSPSDVVERLCEPIKGTGRNAVNQDGGMARKDFIKQLALQLMKDALNMRNQAKYLSRDLQVLIQKHAGTSSLEVGKYLFDIQRKYQ
ncbi:hypothetical protein LAZ67_2004514 [Cordylochernes scorpioides]|uniref:PiggyBac transposable element-derived protein domain-containing protein n=1 Tax=Cordylochernes scorpioides TaxID=51811 RepID=A0ABY6K5E7_9ARAC|nr:hypothetical protein LAZ67_2004514 [Cordylochernes scorpioides]